MKKGGKRGWPEFPQILWRAASGGALAPEPAARPSVQTLVRPLWRAAGSGAKAPPLAARPFFLGTIRAKFFGPKSLKLGRNERARKC